MEVSNQLFIWYGKFRLTELIVRGVDKWPVYNATGGYGENFHLTPKTFGVTPDTFRLAGTTFINSVALEQYGR